MKLILDFVIKNKKDMNWGHKSAFTTIKRFVEAGFGYVINEEGQKIQDIHNLPLGKYKYIGYKD